MPDAEQYFLRLDTARCLTAQGKTVPQIVAHFEEKQLLLPSQSYSAKYRAVQRLVEKIQKDNAKRFSISREENSHALSEYIERQQYLFGRAVEDRQWEVARSLSKDIAKAHGVQTDEPINVEKPDLYTLMKGMSERARQSGRPPLPSLTPAIDVTPDEKI